MISGLQRVPDNTGLDKKSIETLLPWIKFGQTVTKVEVSLESANNLAS